MKDSKRKVGRGKECPRCKDWMDRYEHGPEWKPQGRSYFLFWDKCPSCNHVHNYAEAARSNSNVVQFQKKKKKKQIVVENSSSGAAKEQRAPSEYLIREFYQSWEWKQLRYDFLRGKERVCLVCGAKPSDGSRIVVDHIHPVRRYWYLRFDKENLQILCDDCNMGKGSRDMSDYRRIPSS